MTIHAEHPFVPEEGDRDVARRLRGRLGGAVSLWTTGSAPDARAGLTISSLLVAPGKPPRVLALVDPDSDFAEEVARARVAVVQLLSWRHRQLADAFAGQFPAPGGPFRMATWSETEWGPRLVDAETWAGVRLSAVEPAEVGWSVLLDFTIERAEFGADDEHLEHRRGRYQRPQG